MFHISWCPQNFWTPASSGTGTHASEPFDDPTSFVLIGVKRALSEVGFVFPPTLITHLKKTTICQNWNVMFPSIFSTCQKQVRSFRWNSRSSNCQKQVWTMTPKRNTSSNHPARHFSQANSPLKALAGGLVFTAFGTAFEFARSLQRHGCQPPQQKSYSPEVLTFSPLKNDGKGKRSGFFLVSTHFHGRTVKLQGCNSPPFGATDSVAWSLMLQA